MSRAPANEALITGIGLVSSLGDGVDAHWSRLSSGGVATPVIDEITTSPYPNHPLSELAYEQQIPGRGDRRQMGPWQLLGTYAAGLALTDAGLGEDEDAKAQMDLLVAAGSGERDQESDDAILDEVHDLPDDEVALNRLMMDTLRPTLFLAQLANLLAGNISIVHKVTGSSCTIMGAEMAGVSAVENAVSKIHAGDGQMLLVGGAFNAGTNEHFCLTAGLNRLWDKPYRSVWERGQDGGGACPGSVGVFLVIEASGHAQERGARAYARIDQIRSGREGPASPDCSIRALVNGLTPGPLCVISGASGIEPQTSDERTFLEELSAAGLDLAVRSHANILGWSKDVHFLAGLALAAIAAQRRAFYDPFEQTGFEQPAGESAERFLVTASGQWRGAGAALVSGLANESGN